MNMLGPFFKSLPNLLDSREEYIVDMLSSYGRGVSVSENNNVIFVEADVPGLKPDDIEVSFNDGRLWIKGEKTDQEDDKERKYYKKASSSYSYCVTLPETVDHTVEPEAVCEDGIVKITFTKKSSFEPKKIPITIKK